MIWGWSVCGFVAACVWFVVLCLVCGVGFWLLIGADLFLWRCLGGALVFLGLVCFGFGVWFCGKL